MTIDRSRRVTRRKAGAYTIHDVAEMAQVSSITVSRYFNAPEKVSEALRERLRDVIERIGYVPSQVAGGLASGHGRVVCAVMQNTASTTFADLVKGMSDELEASGLQLLLANAQYSQDREEQALRTFIGWHPTGLILTRDDHSPASEAMLKALNIPIVEAWGFVPERPFHQVGFPHAEAGKQLTKHFLAQGATRVRFVRARASDDFRTEQRVLGYVEEMRSAGLQPDILTVDEDDDFEAGAYAMESLRLQDKVQRPQALVCSNDNVASGAILHAPACGLSLPRDIAIAGFGGAGIGARLTPSLTTLRPDRYGIGQQAARTVLEVLSRSEHDTSLVQKMLPCELLVRESCCVIL